MRKEGRERGREGSEAGQYGGTFWRGVCRCVKQAQTLGGLFLGF